MSLDVIRADLALSLRDDQILSSTSQLSKYGSTSSLYSCHPVMVLFPEHKNDLKQIVTIASKFKKPLHVISCGKNWGYGDTNVASEEIILISLERMNRILETNTEIGFIRIEPGVTQGQLAKHLLDFGDSHMFDVTGGGPQTSIVGNIFERGFGHSHFAIRTDNIGGIEVLLPNGSFIQTSFLHITDGNIGKCFKHGVGPSINDIFTQSSLGIITELNLKLIPKAEYSIIYALRFKSDNDLADAIPKLKLLKEHGVIRGAVHLGNRQRVMTSQLSGKNIHHNDNNEFTLIEGLGLRNGIDAWSSVGTIDGPKAIVQASQKVIRRALARRKIIFLSPPILKFFSSTYFDYLLKTKIGTWLKLQRFKTLHYVALLLRGYPTTYFLRSYAWKSQRFDDAEKIDLKFLPDKGFWINSMIPLTSNDFLSAYKTITEATKKYGFASPTTFTLLNEKVGIFITNINFLEKESDKKTLALQCYRETISSLTSAGYPPYRVSYEIADIIKNKNTTFWEFYSAIKKTVDPLNIFRFDKWRMS